MEQTYHKAHVSFAWSEYVWRERCLPTFMRKQKSIYMDDAGFLHTGTQKTNQEKYGEV